MDAELKRREELVSHGEYVMDPGVKTILERLDVSLDNVVHYYALANELRSSQTLSVQDRADMEEAISKLLSGFKTKIESRKASVSALRRTRGSGEES